MKPIRTDFSGYEDNRPRSRPLADEPIYVY
jgi:hypothetical protein